MAELWVSRVELETLLGEESAAALMHAYGGVPVYIPKRIWPDTTLAKLVGIASLCRLAEVYGGERITVPNGRRPDPHKGRIMRLLDERLSPSAIALRLGVTERYVRAVARQSKHRPRQISLFRLP